MKIYTDYNQIPETAAYIGGSSPDGSIDLSVLDALDEAIEPVCLHDDDGSRHYFDLAITLN
jgi:hypothetical protein